MREVDELSRKYGIEVALFAKKDPEGSMFSNIKNVEEAGVIIAAAIMHSLTNVKVPDNAMKFMDLVISAAGHTVTALKGIQKDITKQFFK